MPAIAPYVPPAHVVRSRARRNTAAIQHVIVVVQENRTVDNLFNGFCVSASQCANTVTIDPYTGIQLMQVSIGSKFYDVTQPLHTHLGFVTDFNHGLMNGFQNGLATAYAYAPATETTAYRDIFSWDGVLNDNTFSANQGPSFPAHQYGIAGQAGGYEGTHEDIAENPQGGSTSCATPAPSQTPGQVLSVNLSTSYPGDEEDAPSCRDHTTIFDLADVAGLTWTYYADGSQPYWTPTQAIMHLYNSPNYITPSDKIISAIQSGTLANVVFVTPAPSNSDHPGNMWNNPTAGGAWVARIVNAIGQSSYWSNTIIVVYWDDWGGWYDHVMPRFAYDPFINPTGGLNPNEYGFRVPYGVVSAYARTGIVAHNVCSISDSLNFIEGIFNLGHLGTEDVLNTGCTMAMVNLNAAAAPFVPIPTAGARSRRTVTTK